MFWNNEIDIWQINYSHKNSIKNAHKSQYIVIPELQIESYSLTEYYGCETSYPNWIISNTHMT